MNRKELIEMFVSIGMPEKVAPVNLSKKFGKKTEISLSEVWAEYRHSKSKYSESVCEYIRKNYPEAEASGEKLLAEQAELEKLLSGKDAILPDELEEVPPVQAIEKLYLKEGKSPKQAKSFAKRAVNEDGSVKRNSKFAKMFLILAMVLGVF
jgi:hypothetical protein